MIHYLSQPSNRLETMTTRVSIATAATREDTVRRALAPVRDDILAKVRGRVIIKPNFLSSVNPLASTQPGAVRPVLELLREGGVDMANVHLAEGGSRSTMQAVEHFGYRPLLEEFGVTCVDLNHGSFSRSLDLVTTRWETHTAEYADFAAEADTVISVAAAKTHDSAVVTLSLKNMMGCLRRVHRPRMHGIAIGSLTSRAAEWFWNAIEGRPLVIKSFSGAVFTAAKFARSHGFHSRGAPPGLLGQVAALAENLRRLAGVLMPDVAVIDAFEAMEGDGPGTAGVPARMNCAVAGTDPIACDTVMARLMGFDTADIGYLTLAGEFGLGTTDPEHIEIMGDDPETLRRPVRPHTNFPVQRRWREAWRPPTEGGGA